MLSIGSDENLVNLGNVNEGVVSPAGRVICRLTVARGAIEETGVYPNIFAIDTTEDLLMALSKNISLKTILL